MSGLHKLVEELRVGSKSEREKGTYFENIVKIYLRNGPKYQDLYSDVWLWEGWRAKWVADGHQDPGVDICTQIAESRLPMRRCQNVPTFANSTTAMCVLSGGPLTNAIANSRNGFSEPHFGDDSQRWLALFARDLTNSIGRFMLNFI